MPLYKVGTYLNAEVTATQYVQADYFTEALGEGLNFYRRGEGEGAARKDTRVGAWMKGTYSYVREVWEPPIVAEEPQEFIGTDKDYAIDQAEKNFDEKEETPDVE